MPPDNNLVAIDKCYALSDDDLHQQILVRENLICQMVGWLYPSILEKEIKVLNDLLALRMI